MIDDDEEEEEPSIPPPKTTYSTIAPIPFLLRFIVLTIQQSGQENHYRPTST